MLLMKSNASYTSIRFWRVLSTCYIINILVIRKRGPSRKELVSFTQRAEDGFTSLPKLKQLVDQTADHPIIKRSLCIRIAQPALD